MSEHKTVYRALTESEAKAKAEALELAGRMAGKKAPLSFSEVQLLFDAHRARDTQDELETIAIGIAFGQAMINSADFEWVRVADEWGQETCVGPTNKAIHCAPISMIQKRLSRREAMLLEDLAHAVTGSMKDKIAEGKIDAW